MAAMMTADPTTAGSPAEPMSVADLGIDRGLVRDLMLKTLFYRGRMNRSELSDELKLSLVVIEELCQSLTQDGLAAVLGRIQNSCKPGGCHRGSCSFGLLWPEPPAHH